MSLKNISKQPKLSVYHCKTCDHVKLVEDFMGNGKQYKMCTECRIKRKVYCKRYYHRNKGLTRVYTSIDDPIDTVPILDYSKCQDNDLREIIDNIFVKNKIDTIDKAKFLMFDMIKYQQSE